MSKKGYKRISFSELHEDLLEHQANLKEAVDAKKIIDELIATSFGGSNEEQMKAVQLLKGLATSDDPASNAFMKKLDAWTSGMKKSESKGGMDESIKSELDKFGADSMKRDGKLVTLTWKDSEKMPGMVKTAAEMAQKIKTDLKKFADKIKHVGASKKGAGVEAEVEMN